MRSNWEFETCACCSREQRLAWTVNDVLWQRVVIDYFLNKILCLECFLKLANNGNVHVELSDIKFIGLIRQS